MVLPPVIAFVDSVDIGQVLVVLIFKLSPLQATVDGVAV
jgi:hypothetical protein